MKKQKKFETCDGNYAAAHIAYMFSEVAAIYPITPSSGMAEYVDEWSSAGLKNIFGDTVKVTEMQSEAGVAGAVHGALQVGALCSTYTASQGLLLMIPNMYKMAGELLPAVFHVSARSIAGHALSIFGDHSDVYAVKQTGFAILATGSVQEIMDLAAIAHLGAIKTRIPFLHFFDGFRTSHEIQKIEMISREDLAPLIDQGALKRFRDNALNPEHPVTRGTAQNPDIFFQAREAASHFYDPVADVVDDYMNQLQKITGREYHPFTYYGHPQAENIIIAMGSVTDTIRETIDHLMSEGEKVGLVTVHLYRPFSEKYFFRAMPSSVKRIAVLDRAKEPAANGEPLYLDVRDIFYGRENMPLVVGGRYGLSSKDTTPAMIVSVYDNLKMNEPKNHFTVGIIDDVKFTSLPLLPEINVAPAGTYEAKFYGLGADGTVGANKNSIKIIGDTTDKFCQAYFSYDSKKSGGITTSHLRFGNHPIRAPYLVVEADFVACHVSSYLDKYDMLKGLKKKGSFLLNSPWDEEETKRRLPDHMKKYLAENQIRFYTINATKIAAEIGMGNKTNSIMQSAFFKVSEVIPYALAINEMKEAVKKSYGRKGDAVIKLNYASIDRGGDVVQIKVPEEWASLEPELEKMEFGLPGFYRDIFTPVNQLRGDEVPVSAFIGMEDGTFPSGSTQYEKRGIAVNVPEWVSSNCILCNQCSFVCPHAAIRPFLLSEEELKLVPDGMVTEPAKAALKNYHYRIQVSVMDCSGCGNCADVCPSKEKSLVMKPLETQLGEIPWFEYLHKNIGYKDTVQPKSKSVQNSQFAQPLFEFSGACAGCGETPYIKTITQLFGERMIVANATGCSSIYGGSSPSTPYCPGLKDGYGPAWANSLFEDNAEYGYGFAIGVNKMRDRIAEKIKQALDEDMSYETKSVFIEWLAGKENAEASVVASQKLIPLLEMETHPLAHDLLALKQYFIKKSIWIFGGDGWAYDIGFGGLDHVMASGEDVNILVMDTEVYSNTGGQASKSTPVGAVAKFAASGMQIRKKDLGVMAMSYGYVYVAQVAMGANHAQLLNAIKEAEAYPGPSLVMAYGPCINHGLVAGMGKSQDQMKRAVEAGYWHNYRYNPMLEKEGKNPFRLDSKEPDWSKFQEFLNSEVRYTSLRKEDPEKTARLFKIAENDARWRYNKYRQLAALYDAEKC